MEKNNNKKSKINNNGIDLNCYEQFISPSEHKSRKIPEESRQKLSELYPQFKNTPNDSYLYFSYSNLVKKT